MPEDKSKYNSFAEAVRQNAASVVKSYKDSPYEYKPGLYDNMSDPTHAHGLVGAKVGTPYGEVEQMAIKKQNQQYSDWRKKRDELIATLGAVEKSIEFFEGKHPKFTDSELDVVNNMMKNYRNNLEKQRTEEYLNYLNPIYILKNDISKV